MGRLGDQLRGFCCHGGQDLDTISLFWLVLVLGGMKRGREKKRYSGWYLSFCLVLLVRWLCHSQNWGALKRHWVCEADPKSGGRHLGHPNGDGEEVAQCIDQEHRVRSYRNLFRAPEGSRVEMCTEVMSGFWTILRLWGLLRKKKPEWLFSRKMEWSAVNMCWEVKGQGPICEPQ